MELVTPTWLYPQTLSRPFSCCRIVYSTAADPADEENFFVGPGGRSILKMYTGGGGLATTDPRTMHIQQITGFFSRVGFFLFFSFFFKMLLALLRMKKKRKSNESVPSCNRYNSVMETLSLFKWILNLQFFFFFFFNSICRFQHTWWRQVENNFWNDSSVQVTFDSYKDGEPWHLHI